MNTSNKSRRGFLRQLGMAALSLPTISAFATGNNISFNKKRDQKGPGKLGIALVGLGNYATGQLAPALQKTEHCFLAGIVTGTPEKAQKWKAQYNIPDENIYDYKSFDSIKNNPEIEIVYVVLPNSMHAEYVIRAAQAGKHVICEKPMAITVSDCDRMIAACKKAGKKLSIGYRLHFEPYNLEMARLGQTKVFGPVKKVKGEFGFVAQKGIWRLKKEMAGGGPLMDLGIYCVQAAIYITGTEPMAVTAKENPKDDLERFSEVEEALSWQLEMPGGVIAEGRASYAESANLLRAEAEKGWFQLTPAYNYSGLKGESSEGIMAFPQAAQQAVQMDHFAQCIRNNRPSIVPGEMGRRDVKILQAIYEAMRTGKRVVISKK